jgi:hypothetical protein
MSKKKEQIVFSGKIWHGEFGDNYNALFIGYNSTPFAKRWQQELGWGKTQVTVRYWISDKEQTKEELIENQVLRISGAASANYSDRYSELTGYLWTDENLKVGGHDLMAELESNYDKFLYMEVDIH